MHPLHGTEREGFLHEGAKPRVVRRIHAREELRHGADQRLEVFRPLTEGRPDARRGRRDGRLRPLQRLQHFGMPGHEPHPMLVVPHDGAGIQDPAVGCVWILEECRIEEIP